MTQGLIAALVQNPLEVAAVVSGIVSVWLSTREHIASWPTAIVNVTLYFIIFQQAKLYAGMGLQVVYFVLSCYGWYEWKFGGANRSELPVSRATRRHATRLVPLGVAGTAAFGLLLASATDAALPWVDSGAAMTSLLAQWMMTRKLLENWLVWLAVDTVYVAMFISNERYLTAALYATFFGLAVMGYARWRRSYLRDASPAVGAA